MSDVCGAWSAYVAWVTVVQHGGPHLYSIYCTNSVIFAWSGKVKHSHLLSSLSFTSSFSSSIHILKKHTWKILMLLSIYLHQELCKQLKAVSWNPKKIPSSWTLMNLTEHVQLVLFSGDRFTFHSAPLWASMLPLLPWPHASCCITPTAPRATVLILPHRPCLHRKDPWLLTSIASMGSSSLVGFMPPKTYRFFFFKAKHLLLIRFLVTRSNQNDTENQLHT